ncbi:MAG: hypothetical protein JW791_03995 [Nanoarchaeota archaeon]|nr:hypothetical protein [Nanoarchaeota archaeon]
MALIDDILTMLSDNPTSSAIVFLAGFILCHLVHAFRYGFLGFGRFFDKVKKFVKVLLFMGNFS